MPREILTIQFGHYSNFVGTHWWNLQENNFSYDPGDPSEINNDVLYREGENPQRQVTYTPRVLIADLKGAFGQLKEEGTLYHVAQDEETDVLWDDSKVEVTKEEDIDKISFPNGPDEPKSASESTTAVTDDNANTWADYLLARFHSRSLNIIKQYKHNSTEQPFDIYMYGKNLWNTLQFSENFTEKIRAYVEECDQMQGFQVILDSENSFGGLGTSCIEHLQDEYGKTIISFPCIDGKKTAPSKYNLIKVLNTALCWQHIGEHSALYSPLSCGQTVWPSTKEPRAFNHLSYDSELNYHSSALLATALDVMSIRYRRKEYPNVVLADMCADLNKTGRKAVATSLTLPFPMTAKADLIDVLDEWTGPLWTSLTPNCEIQEDRAMQSIALRGIPEDRLKQPMAKAMKQMAKPAYRCSTVHEMMTLYLASTSESSATYLSNISSPLKIKDPYPQIFNNNVTETGDIMGWPQGDDVKSVAVMAGLHSGNSLQTMYESVHKQLTRIRSIKQFHAFIESGLEEDEYRECLNHLLDCKENYEDKYI